MRVKLVFISAITFYLDYTHSKYSFSRSGPSGAGVWKSVWGWGVRHGLCGGLCGLHKAVPLDGETVPEGHQLLPHVRLLGLLHLLVAADPAGGLDRFPHGLPRVHPCGRGGQIHQPAQQGQYSHFIDS